VGEVRREGRRGKEIVRLLEAGLDMREGRSMSVSMPAAKFVATEGWKRPLTRDFQVILE
jgi:hypothetical protein